MNNEVLKKYDSSIVNYVLDKEHKSKKNAPVLWLVEEDVLTENLIVLTDKDKIVKLYHKVMELINNLRNSLDILLVNDIIKIYQLQIEPL